MDVLLRADWNLVWQVDDITFHTFLCKSMKSMKKVQKVVGQLADAAQAHRWCVSVPEASTGNHLQHPTCFMSTFF
jgi:hypothetical protein